MWYQFPAPILLELSGKDAQRYLNNRLTNDIRGCAPGDSTRAAILNPQGRTEGLFSVHALEGGRYVLACEGGDFEEVKAALCRYLVADRVSVSDISSDHILLHAEGEALSAANLPNALVISVPRISTNGKDIVLPKAQFEEWRTSTSSAGEPLTLSQFNITRTRFGGVSYPEEVNADTILTEVGLKDLVSFSKGCYVGQEVIERSDAIGKLPRKLERARFSGVTALKVGTPIKNREGEAIGKVASAFADEHGGETLAFVLLRTGKYAPGEALMADDVNGELLA
jgi:aminomethyltransferase